MKHVLRVAAAMGLFSSFGLAENTQRTAAVVLFDNAQQLMEKGKFAEACPKYAESNRLDPQLGALLHLADCYEKAGQYASAWSTFRDAAELADRRADERSLTAIERAQALEGRLNRLTINVPAGASVPGLVVQRDGREVGKALWGLAIPVDSGKHVIIASAPGKQEWRYTVAVLEPTKSETVTIPALVETIATLPSGGGVATVASSQKDAVSTDATSSWMVPVGWTSVAVGAASVGAGVAYQFMRASKLSDRDDICPSGKGCTDQQIRDINLFTDDARKANTFSVVGFVAGGALVAGGITMFLLAPTDSKSNTPATGKTTMTPVATVGYQGIHVTRSW